jgi:hypothetical protein
MYSKAFDNVLHEDILKGLLWTETLAKRQLLHKKRNFYVRVLQNGQLQTSKMNPFFLVVFTKSVFAAWRKYAEELKSYVEQ